MTPFQKIPEACKTTGLSQYFLRKGCKDGTIPHIRSGPTYYIDVPALLRKLGGEAVWLRTKAALSDAQRSCMNISGISKAAVSAGRR